jgi:hypothetical protein
MKTIKLNITKVFEKNSTSKYWRKVECSPQNVELMTWSSNHPYFILEGKIISSHDEKEIGQITQIHNQTYSFWLEDLIEQGVYSI